jgi:pyridoxal biosynthesis lyase PdxS
MVGDHLFFIFKWTFSVASVYGTNFIELTRRIAEESSFIFVPQTGHLVEEKMLKEQKYKISLTMVIRIRMLLLFD